MSSLLLAITNLASAQAVHAVEVSDTGYTPSDLVILRGDTVEWTWVGAAGHSVTADAAQSESFDSGVLAAGTFSHQFGAPPDTTTYGSSVDGAAFSGSVEVINFRGLSLNEILADPGTLAGDANCDGVINTTQDEFIEIVNDTGSTADLSGATISDAVQVRHTFAAGTTLADGASLLVFGGGTPRFDGSSTSAEPWCIDLQGTEAIVASTGTLGLNNTGDDIVLRAASGDPLDSFSYGSEGDSDESLVRSPELTRSVMVQHTTTPAGATWSPGTDVNGVPWGGVAGPALSEFTPGTVGIQNSITVTGGPASTAGILVVGFNAGNTPVPGGACPGLFIGIQAPTKVGQRNTNAAGEATLSLTVPAGAAGRDVLAQVVFPNTCEVSAVSVTAF